jgi:hypothetical protein
MLSVRRRDVSEGEGKEGQAGAGDWLAREIIVGNKKLPFFVVWLVFLLRDCAYSGL